MNDACPPMSTRKEHERGDSSAVGAALKGIEAVGKPTGNSLEDASVVALLSVSTGVPV